MAQAKKRKKPIEPTILQKRAFEAIVENTTAQRPKSIRRILKDVGYSQSAADNPKAVTETEGFKTLMIRSGITDMLLLTKLKDGLDADKPYGKDGGVHPDYSTRHKYLETSLKLMGVEQAPVNTAQNTYNIAIQQNNIDPNSTEAKDIVSRTLDILMDQTRAE